MDTETQALEINVKLAKIAHLKATARKDIHAHKKTVASLEDMLIGWTEEEAKLQEESKRLEKIE